MTTPRTSREPVPHTCAALDAIQRLLDEVRSANDALRAWGNEEADEADRLRAAMGEVLAIFEDRERYVMMGPRGALEGAAIIRRALSIESEEQK
ncbi:MAG: hypothetical protein V1755_14110 [Chloroflexota bacterium]